jgi:hypothetical protein
VANKTKEEKNRLAAIEAEHKSARWLSKGREAEAKGNRAQVEACYEASTHWLMKANELLGKG